MHGAVERNLFARARIVRHTHTLETHSQTRLGRQRQKRQKADRHAHIHTHPHRPNHIRVRAQPRTCAGKDAKAHILPLKKQITLQLCLVFPCAHPLLIGSEALLWRGGRVHVWDGRCSGLGRLPLASLSSRGSREIRNQCIYIVYIHLEQTQKHDKTRNMCTIDYRYPVSIFIYGIDWLGDYDCTINACCHVQFIVFFHSYT